MRFVSELDGRSVIVLMHSGKEIQSLKSLITRKKFSPQKEAPERHVHFYYSNPLIVERIPDFQNPTELYLTIINHMTWLG